MSLKKYLKGKFDWDVSGLAAYVDEQREDLIVRSVTEARTLQYLSIQQGIKGSQELKLLDDSVVYQQGDCTMTPSGDTVFTDRAIAVETLGYMKSFCQKDLDGFWTQLGLRPGAMAEDKTLPFEQQIINYLLQLHSFELDKLIWKGNKATGSGNLAFMNGFRQFLTTANGFICFTGRENFNFLTKNLVDDNLFHYNPANIGDLNELILPGTNMRIVKVNGLNGLDNIYTGRASQFVFGTDLSSDFENFDLWYSLDDDLIYVRSKFRAGVQVPFLDQIGVWNGTSSPN